MPVAKVSEHMVVVKWTIDFSGQSKSPLADAIRTWILPEVDVMRRSM